MNTHSDTGSRRPRAAPRPPADPERRAVILQAAQQSFARHGFHRTTMRAVARQAGLAEGTLYNHFANKDALLLGLFASLGEQSRTALDLPALAALELREFLHTFLAAPLAALGQDNHALIRVILSEALIRPELGQAFAASLAHTAELGAQALAGRPELRDVDTAALLQLGLTQVLGLTVERALAHTSSLDADVAAARVTELLMAQLPESRP